MNEDILRFFKTMGAEKAFIISSFKEALIDFGITTKKIIDRNIINPFVLASSQIIESKSRVKSQAGQIFLKKTCCDFFGDLTCIFPVVDENYSGAISLSFPETTILKIMSGIHGRVFDHINDQVLKEVDALSTTILSRAQSELLRRGYTMQSITPSLVRGRRSPFAESRERIVVIPFESCAGKYYLELCQSAQYKGLASA